MSTPAARRSSRRSPSKAANPNSAEGAGADSIPPTPRRATRGTTPRAETKLPSLASKASNAYGGAANMPLANAMTGETAKSTFAAALEKKREELAQAQQDDPSEDSDAPDPAPPRRKTPARSKKAATPLPTAIDEADEDEPQSSNQAKKSKGKSTRVQEHSTVARDLPLANSLLDHPDYTFTAESHAANGSGRVSPGAKDSVLHHRRRPVNNGINSGATGAIPRPRQQSISDEDQRQQRVRLVAGATILTLLLMSYILFYAVLPRPMQEVPVYGKTAVVQVGHWLSSFGSGGQDASGLPFDVSYRLESLSNQIEMLKEQRTFHSSSISELRNILPNALVMNRDAYGNYVIPDHFWTALKSKTSAELGLSVDDSAWEQFLNRNSAELNRLIGNTVDEQLGTAIRNKIIVSPETFEQAIRDNFANLNAELEKATAHMNNQLASLQSSISKTATDVSRAVVKDSLQALPQAQLHSLAAANLLKNMADAMSSVNYFSASLGAIVDPMLSSPTQLVPVRGLGFAGALKRLFGKTSANPPLSALEPWNEHGDCWCAARTAGPPRVLQVTRGGSELPLEPFEPKAQLAVVMPRHVYIDSITIEHVPVRATLDISSAPQDLELWIPIKDKAVRERVWDAVLTHNDPDGAWREPKPIADTEGMVSRWPLHSLAKMLGFGGPSPSDPNVADSAPLALPADYVRVASWQYRIHDANHVQTVPVDADLESLSASTRRAVVRATSNFGADYTCLYRVRVHGKTVEMAETERQAML